MALRYLWLNGTDGQVTVRPSLDAVDAPADGDWTPDNLNDGQEGTADSFILDARMWESVRVYALIDGAPSDAVTVVPVVAVKGESGRDWLELEPVPLEHLESALVPVHGHLCAFRVSALSASAAAVVKVTGGQQKGTGLTV